MKTDSRVKIVEIVRKNGTARPFDLAKKLGISPQAIHRHLKSLVADGTLERRGRGPLARYQLAGTPRFERARLWYSSSGRPEESPPEFVCETRDVFAGRLGRLAAFADDGLPSADVPLAISAAGEVGNNCFDHNLGNWRDVPGCWFEAQATGGRLWVCIADRGQGVLNSLRHADPSLRDEQQALIAAFERTLSGRAPENRGNGLKFVRNIMNGNPLRGLACRSGAGLVDYGAMGKECRGELAPFPSTPAGTATLLLWSLK